MSKRLVKNYIGRYDVYTCACFNFYIAGWFIKIYMFYYSALSVGFILKLTVLYVYCVLLYID